MNHIKLILLSLTLMFTSGVALGETMDDLVERGDLWYKKFTDVPFTGEISGKVSGKFINGKKHGSWNSYDENGQLYIKTTYKNGIEEGPSLMYDDNGQLMSKGNVKNGKRDGLWIDYWSDGTVNNGLTGQWKNGVKISN